MILATSAHHELADAVCHIEIATGVLRGKAFVVMVVATQHHIRVVGVEVLPDGLHEGFVPFIP